MNSKTTGQDDVELRELLTQEQPEIPFRFFYDDRGMELFGQITKLPEYYPTRTETEILRARAVDIMRRAAARSICELGAGEAVKVRLLIEAGLEVGGLESVELVDVNREAVEGSCQGLARAFAGVAFSWRVVDLTRELDFLGKHEPQLVAYLGGSFGNFGPDQRADFLGRLARAMAPGDRLLLGVDLVKDKGVLEAAYDDSQGVTAEFNLNALRHLNRVTGSDFVPYHFEHVARYDETNQWIELGLRAKRACEVEVPSVDVRLSFEPGDLIRTELSCKYTRGSLEGLAHAAGLEIVEWFVDERDWFGLALLRPARK